MSFKLRHCHRCSFQSKVDRNMYPALFLLYRKLRRISYKAKKRSAGCALARRRNMSQATALREDRTAAEQKLSLRDDVVYGVFFGLG